MSQKRSLAQITLHGTFWTYGSYYSGKLMVFVSTIILARLLLKDDFGVAGYALVFISLLEVFNDLGIGAALIYYRDKMEAPNTAFWLGLAISLVLFIITYLLAPFAGVFFQDMRAVPVTQVLALTLPISALGNIHSMLLQKDLAFKRKFIPEIVSALSKGILSIFLAVLGFGVWSLIIGQIAGKAFGTVTYWWVLPWRPSFHFARRFVRPLLSYGLSIVSVNVLATILANADYLFVGRFLGSAALGVYTLAFRMPDLLILQFCNIIAKVIFPVYAKLQNEGQVLGQGFLATTRYVSLITVPMGLGLALIAKPFVLTFFTEKWIEAVPVMRAISIFALFLSLAYNAGDVYKAQGRPEVLTKLALVRAVILIPGLWFAASRLGTIAAVGWTHAIVAFVAGALELVVASRLLNIPFNEILKALRPAAVSGSLMAVAVWGTLMFSMDASPVVQLLVSVAVGAITYVGTLWWLQHDLILEASYTLRAALVRR